jgi:hypothetical protein
MHFVMRDGTSTDGYIVWNEFAFDEIFQSSATRAAVGGILSKNGWDTQRPQEISECYSRWIELMNRILQSGVIDSPYYRTTTIYKKLEEIHYPSNKYVGVDGSVSRISWRDVAAISANPELSLEVNTTGIDVLPQMEVERLANEKPRFTVEQGFDVGSTVYAVYGDSVTVGQLLGHIVRNSSSYDLGDINIDDTQILARRDGPQLKVELSSKEDRSPLEDEALVFLAKLDKYRQEVKAAVAPCEREARNLGGGPISMIDGHPSKPPQPERVRAMMKICSAKENALRNRYWSSLGSKSELRDRGVFSFSNGWD